MIRDTLKAEPEEVKEETGDRRNNDGQSQRDGGPD